MTKQHRAVRVDRNNTVYVLNTTPHDWLTIRGAVVFALKGLDVDGAAVHIKNLTDRSATYGRCYYGIPSIANVPAQANALLVARADRSLDLLPRLVRTLAHEGRHLDYHRATGRGGGERRACAFARMRSDQWLLR